MLDFRYCLVLLAPKTVNFTIGVLANLSNNYANANCPTRFRYLGTALMNQNSIEDGIKSRLKSENACLIILTPHQILFG
jgi:hypothetical protein